MLHKAFMIVCSLLCLATSVFGQFGSNTARRITSGTAAPPALCNAGPVDVYARTGATSPGLYLCLTTNTWTGPLGGSGTTINPTNNVLPKRSTATTFADSSLTDTGTVITGTEPIQLADGSQSTPSYSFSGSTNIGFHRSGNNILADIGGGPQVAFNGAAGLELPAANWMAWSSVTDPTSAPDTTIARTAAKSFKFGGGGDSTGNIQTAAYKTDTNCSAVGTAANPSVASCVAASAGSFSCATNASTGTCTVNTTAVTTNSEIFVMGRNDTTTGTRLGVTCNTGITTAIPEIATVVAATSFTINLGTFTTNPECFSYFIVN